MEKTKTLRILHLEDDIDDVRLVQKALAQQAAACDVQVVTCRAEYLEAVETGGFDVVLSDSGVADIDALEALRLAKGRSPGVPFLCVSGQFDRQTSVDGLAAAGAADCILKSELSRLAPAIRRVLETSDPPHAASPTPAGDLPPMERLLMVIQELSLARDLETIMTIVRRSARELTGADGATFVLRDGNLCYYADEDAISPLWKGQRFPMDTCISGWAMRNRRQAVIEDIYGDERIPHDAYRPTFVKSLVMVPIRTLDPIGAIGNYWANHHAPAPQEVKLLQALADATAVAMENVQVYSELEQRVDDRTARLHAANKELETFAYAVSHDLRAPLRHIDGFSRILGKELGDGLSDQARQCIDRICHAVAQMNQLIEDLLNLSRTAQATPIRDSVDLGRIAGEILSSLTAEVAGRRVELEIAEALSARGDPGLLRVVMDNLLSNAWKFTSRNAVTRIEVGSTMAPDGRTAYFVRDNGAGFDDHYAARLFQVFQRLHTPEDFPGTGVGLATVQRIIHKHGGQIWAESKVNEGATFYFTLE